MLSMCTLFDWPKERILILLILALLTGLLTISPQVQRPTSVLLFVTVGLPVTADLQLLFLVLVLL